MNVLISSGIISVLITAVGSLIVALVNASSNRKLSEKNELNEREITRLRDDLDKANNKFKIYSKGQYDSYRELWEEIVDTQKLANTIWDDRKKLLLTEYSKRLKKLTRAVAVNRILIEENEYKILMDIIDKFEKYEFGKTILGEKLFLGDITDEENKKLNDELFNDRVEKNGNLWAEYNNLIEGIADSLRERLKGRISHQ